MIPIEAKYRAVAVIFAAHAQKQIGILAATMPVWVIESPENANAITEARQRYQSPLTVFFARPGESKMDMCSRILYDIDDHHQCDILELYGVSTDDIDSEVLADLKIHSVHQTEYGCQLTRKVSAQ